MKTFKTLLPVAALSALAVVPFGAFAYDNDGARAQPQIYLGGGVGYNWLNGQPFKDPNNPDHDFSKNHLSWKGLAGVKFNDVLSLEGQYIDFGAHNKDNDNVKAHGWTAGLVLDLPVSPVVTPYAKVGALFWNSDGTYTSTGTLAGTGFNKSGTDLTWGGGARFKLSQNVDLRVEYERFRLASETHVDNATAAIQYNF